MLARQAVSLRRVADDLQNGLHQMTKGDGPTTSDADKTSRVLGYAVSMVMLRALATELLLKALAFKKTGRYRRKGRHGHDLLILFNDLDSDTKKIVAAQESSQGIAPLKQILEKHKDDFIKWRYVAESDGSTVGFLDLDKAFLVLIAVYRHKDFLKSCPDSGGASLESKLPAGER